MLSTLNLLFKLGVEGNTLLLFFNILIKSLKSPDEVGEGPAPGP